MMPLPSYEQAREAASSRLSTRAMGHCERVAETAARLAAHYGVDVESARIAGLLHDWARELGDAGLLEAARAYGVPVDEVDHADPYLLHAEVSAAELRDAFPGLPAELIDAVSCHTFGRVGMTPLDEIVYIADTIEPGRDLEGVEELREMVPTSPLRDLFVAAYARSLAGLIAGRRPIHPGTAAVWNAIVTGASG